MLLPDSSFDDNDRVWVILQLTPSSPSSTDSSSGRRGLVFLLYLDPGCITSCIARFPKCSKYHKMYRKGFLPSACVATDPWPWHYLDTFWKVGSSELLPAVPAYVRVPFPFRIPTTHLPFPTSHFPSLLPHFSPSTSHFPLSTSHFPLFTFHF